MSLPWPVRIRSGETSDICRLGRRREVRFNRRLWQHNLHCHGWRELMGFFVNRAKHAMF